MNDTSNKRIVIVGVFIILGLAFLAAGVLVIGNLHETFSRKIRVVTVLNDVSGLQAGNNIWFSGVKVGTVKNIQFFGRSEVKVVMRIDKKVQQYIRKDAKVKISTDGLIGNKIIVIYGGSPQAGVVTDGDTLGVEQSLSAETMMNTLQESNKNILDITADVKTITKKIANGEGSAGQLIADDRLYNKIDAAAGSLQMAAQEAQKMVKSLAELSAGLNRKGTLLHELGRDTSLYTSLRSSVSNFRQVSDTAVVLVNSLKTAGSGTKGAVGILLNDEKAGNDLKSTLKNLESSSQKLDQNMEGLQHSFLLRKYFRKKNKEKK